MQTALMLFLASAGSVPVRAADPGLEFFEQKIRPVLVKHCYECHSAKAKKVQGGLRLDTRAWVLKGGDSGPVLIPGNIEGSLLVQALRHDTLAMPPRGKLPAAVIADFERWVALGAPDPRSSAAGERQAGGMRLDEGRKFWAYRPPQRCSVPVVRDVDWPIGTMDRFILARLEQAGLHPVADADRPTLARRLYFDLIGLPPSPEVLDAFAAARDPNAYQKLVDQLLASPAYGERWGRHWLDIARFAESVTLRGQIFKEAWRYRDYVIDAFNQDLPFDRFICEQIAGDLLPAPTYADRARQLTATAFLAPGNHNHEEQDKQQLRMDVVDEQLDVIGKGLLAQTLTCARCHDHKFDPIPTTDYYALAGILRNAILLEDANLSTWIEVPLPADPETEARLQPHEAAVAAMQARIAAEKARAPMDSGAQRATLRRLESELKKLQANGPQRQRTMSVLEASPIEDARVHIRGSVHTLGERVPRGFLRVATLGRTPVLPVDASGRRQLAEWIAAADNPLTARVIVNRVWHWLFGVGIVRTTDNFGTTGEPPSHPELLDYLAVQFVEDGWSIKKLVRRIVLSRTYRQASLADRVGSIGQGKSSHPESVDPENRLLARHNRRRQEAECLRDAMLQISGQLRRDRGGPTFAPTLTADYSYRHADTRRSVYSPAFRNAPPDLLAAFDSADTSVVTGQRNSSIVAPQALFMINHPFVIEQARSAAHRLLAEHGLDDNALTTRAYRLTLGREPTDGERAITRRFLQRMSSESEAAWAILLQSLFASAEFRYVN